MEQIKNYFKNLNLAGKINAINCTITVLIFLLLGVTLLTNIYNKSTKTAEDYSKKVAALGAQEALKRFDKTRSELRILRDTLLYAKEHHTMTREQVTQMLRTYTTNNPNVHGYYTLWEPNKFDGQDSKYVNKVGHDRTGRFIPYLTRFENRIMLEPLKHYTEEGVGDYYVVTKRTRKLNLTEPFQYEIQGKNILLASMAMPIIDKNGVFLGVVGADFDLEYIQKLIEKIKPMGGYSSLVSTKGVFVANGFDKNVIMKSCVDYGLGAVLEKTAKGNEVIDYAYSKISKKDVLRVFEPVKLEGADMNWSLGSVIPKSAIMVDFNFYLSLIIFGIFIAIVILIAINTVALKKLVNPINLVVNTLEQVAQGNLKVNVDESALSNDEIGKLGQALNNTIRNLSELVTQVVSSVDEIQKGSEEMNTASDQTAQGAQQVANSVSQLAAGSQEQANSVNMSVGNINEMSQAIQTISANADSTVTLSKSTENNAVDGRNQAEKAVTRINQLKITATDVANTINELGQLSSDIEQIVDLIKGIASQTNLLALNAAIEAARAGEHGKGFAVVAEEVKKLAGESAEATDKITVMIKEIQNKTNTAVVSMNEAVEEVNAGVTIVVDTGHSLEEILNAAQTTSDQIANISKEVNNLASSSENIVRMMENISSITEESAASSEEISSIVEEQTASLEEINASSQSLAKIAENLQKQVSVFKV